MFAHFRSENYAFIVTEYIPNGTLEQLICEYQGEPGEYNYQQKRFTEKVWSWCVNIVTEIDHQLNI